MFQPLIVPQKHSALAKLIEKVTVQMKFFYFLKIIFDISVLKLSKKINKKLI
jgi:hypothetical protein